MRPPTSYPCKSAFVRDAEVSPHLIKRPQYAKLTLSCKPKPRSIPTHLLKEGAGLGPRGCGSTFDSPDQEITHLLDVALSFTCGSTGEEIIPAAGSAAFDWNFPELMISLSNTGECVHV